MSIQLLTPNFCSSVVLDMIYSLSLETQKPLEIDEDIYRHMYCFLSGIEPWDAINDNPPAIVYSDYFLKDVYKNIFVMKKINPIDICAVIERIDWTFNTIYQRYNDTKNMFDLDSSGKLINKFYVKNSYDQVFKCIWNGETTTNSVGTKSTVEPKVLSGSSIYDLVKLSDGYVWLYLYTINPNQKYSFLSSDYLPIPKPNFKSDISSTLISAGAIESININNGGGSGYTNDAVGNITTIITIYGDGIGATASCIVVGNIITNINITNAGYGYTYASCIISNRSPYSGSGATATVTISPINGSKSDLISELGCRTALITCTFTESESGIIPTDIDFRQAGILYNPNLVSGGYADGSLYNTAITVYMSSGYPYVKDETVTQLDSNQNAIFSATVLSYDSTRNILYIINTVGTLNEQLLLGGNISGAKRIVLYFIDSDIVRYSGKIIYIENRKSVQRSDTGIEQFRLTIGF